MMEISKKTAILALALCFAAMPGLAQAGLVDNVFGKPQIIECNAGASSLDWVGLTYLALLIGIIIVSIGRMLQGLFDSPKYNEFIKNTLWSLVQSAAILSVFSLALVGLQNFGIENIDTARTYATITRNTISFDFVVMVGASAMMGFVTNINPQFKIPGTEYFGISFQIGPMFKPLIDSMGQVMQLMTTALGLWNAQLYLLCFIKDSMLALFLPAGLFLRALGIKGGGNVLIGIAAAMYFIYPFLMVQAGEIVTNHIATDIARMNAPHVWGTCTDKPICCLIPTDAMPASIGEAFVPNGKNWENDLRYRVSQEKVLKAPFFISLGTSTPVGVANTCMYNTVLASAYKTVFVDLIGSLSIWDTVVRGGGIISIVLIFLLLNLSWVFAIMIIPITVFVMNSITEMVYFVFIVTIILPLFVIFITLTFAREISKVLGTEIDLSSLEKLI